ncbi:MAG: hypothetical protein PHV20_02940 [Bacteroidales bacterium]|nr:hypothetical protein [Bacteroidales bacterium]
MKKAVHQVTAALFTECIMFRELIPGTDTEKANLILDEILKFQEEFISRINNYSGKENPKVVRIYFNKLSQDVVEEAQKLFQKINETKK